MLHPVKVMMSYGERILASFTLTEEISEHLKAGGDVQIIIGGHDREQNWGGYVSLIKVEKIGGEGAEQ